MMERKPGPGAETPANEEKITKALEKMVRALLKQKKIKSEQAKTFFKQEGPEERIEYLTAIGVLKAKEAEKLLKNIDKPEPEITPKPETPEPETPGRETAESETPEPEEEEPHWSLEGVRDAKAIFEQEFGINAEELSVIGFDELTEGQRLAVAENLRQITLGRIQDQARGRYQKKTAESNKFGKFWQYLSKYYQIAGEEKSPRKKLCREALPCTKGF